MPYLNIKVSIPESTGSAEKDEYQGREGKIC